MVVGGEKKKKNHVFISRLSFRHYRRKRKRKEGKGKRAERESKYRGVSANIGKKKKQLYVCLLLIRFCESRDCKYTHEIRLYRHELVV